MRYPFKKDSVFESIEWTFGRNAKRFLKVANFLRFFRIGMQNRYPICCVIHFAWDVIHKRKPALLRGSIGTFPGSMYVPCKFHMRRHPTWTPYGGAPREQLRLFSDEVGKT